MQSVFSSLDWQRMFLGDAPPGIYLEITIRTLIIYAYSLALLRWIGGRGIAQMSVIEFLLVVALGSAVGDAMFYPDVPILHAMLVITLVCIINKALDLGMCHSRLVRRVFAGRTVRVIDDGRIDLGALQHLKVSREELFEGLRTQGVANIGRVEEAYLETGGTFSVFRRRGPVRGLSIRPEEAGRPLSPGPPPPRSEPRVCASCAASAGHAEARCRHCGSPNLVAALPDDDKG